METSLPPDECYAAMGFQPFSGGPHVMATQWRTLRESQQLAHMQERYKVQQELAGAPLVDHGYVVGWVPKHGLAAPELERLLKAIQSGLDQGCQTLQELRSSVNGKSAR